VIKALHTSDWHLGAQLYERDRLEEQRLFLGWLTETVKEEQIRLLLVTGDIFDSHAPSIQAQTLYYEFLAGLLETESGRPEIIITAGNHDSPQFLNAPREILSRLRIHVVSGMAGPEDLDREIFEIRDEKNNPLLAVCAVPFLRERDLKIAADPAGGDDPLLVYRRAACAHYHAAAERARAKIPGTPLVITGHLFLGGALLSDEDSERFREVGRLSSMPPELLPQADYYALGHLHRPQCVMSNECWRYSGSPIPMSFGEGNQVKSVVIAAFENKAGRPGSPVGGPRIALKEIPRFSRLEQIKGDAADIRRRLEEISCRGESAFIDIQVTHCEGNILDFWAEIEHIQAAALEKRRPIAILAKQDMRPGIRNAVMPERFTEVASLRPMDVFEQKLDGEQLEGPERETFAAMFREIEGEVLCGGDESDED
jgi:exonuclease SbcD